MQRRLIVLLVSACAGCASAQVNENTLDIASTYDQLITRQVAFNLHKTLGDPFGVPAFARVTVQSAQTTNSISPTLTFPLTAQISKLAQSALGPTGLTATTSRTAQTAGTGVSLAASDQWNQGYTITPVIDPDQLRRLRLLFQYASRTLEGVNYADPQGHAAAAELFEISYPLIEAAPSGGGGTSSSLTVTIDGKSVVVKQASAPAAPARKQYVRRTFATDAEGNVTGTTWARVSPDLTFVAQPGCIMCDYGHALTEHDLQGTTDKDIIGNSAGLTKLEKNADLSDEWLIRPGEALGPGAIRLPSAELYARDEGKGLKYFDEFVLFCVEAASQGTGSPSSGGQSEGRKTANPQTIDIPVGGLVTSP